jgi:hypothetical protein
LPCCCEIFSIFKKIFFKRTNAFLSLGYQKYPTPPPQQRAKIGDDVDYYDTITVDIMELAYQRRIIITKNSQQHKTETLEQKKCITKFFTKR